MRRNKPAVIAIDFDGTCVTHDFPDLGKDIGAAEVLLDLVAEGHQLILWTIRSGGHREDAELWFKHKNIPLHGINENPTQHRWSDSRKAYAELYIDDAALGAPTVVDIKLSDRPFICWKKTRKLLEMRGFLTPKE